MDHSLLARIRGHAAARGQTPRGIAREAEIVRAERELGFPLPSLIKDCYRQVGNGGFGPSYGLIGLGPDGSQGDFGDLVKTYRQYEQDSQIEGKSWAVGLLPFCDYGCNIYDCVDCLDPEHPIRTIDQGEFKRSIGSLDDFIERWLNGIDEPFCRASEETIEFDNPFTKRKETRTIRRLL